MSLGQGYTVWIGFSMPMAPSAFPVTITTLTTFAMMVSRDVVPVSFLSAVSGPGIVSMSIHFWLLVGMWLIVRGEVWIRVSMHFHISSSVARALVSSSMAVTGSPMMAPFTVSLAPAPRDARI